MGIQTPSLALLPSHHAPSCPFLCHMSCQPRPEPWRPSHCRVASQGLLPQQQEAKAPRPPAFHFPGPGMEGCWPAGGATGSGVEKQTSRSSPDTRQTPFKETPPQPEQASPTAEPQDLGWGVVRGRTLDNTHEDKIQHPPHTPAFAR